MGHEPAGTLFLRKPLRFTIDAHRWVIVLTRVQWGLQLLEAFLPPQLFERVYTAANDPNFEPPDPGILPALNGQTGELVKNVPMLRMYRVSRRRFRRLCSEDIDVQVSPHGNTIASNS